MNPLYDIEVQKVGLATAIRTIVKRGSISSPSAWKVVPPIIEYSATREQKDLVVSYVVKTLPDVIQDFKPHPYKANSPQFSQERLAQLEISAIYALLENFPTISSADVIHPMSALIYGNQVYLKPSPETDKLMNSMGFLEKGTFLGEVFQQLSTLVTEYNIDFYSLPKKKIGKIAYTAPNPGETATIAKVLGFGFSKGIGANRITREASSLKSAEPFINPINFESDVLPDDLRPYVTLARVGVIFPENSMMDGADITPSGIKQLAVKQEKRVTVNDVRSFPTDMSEWKIQLAAHRGGINIFHEERLRINEIEEPPSCFKMVFPNGIKVLGGAIPKQAYDNQGREIDVILDLRTFVEKGALAALVMLHAPNFNQNNLSLQQLQTIFNMMKKEEITIGTTKYLGYSGVLPVIRPRMRQVEMNKVADVGVDLITMANLKLTPRVNRSLEQKYTILREARIALSTKTPTNE
jgi:hypothetical protein